MSDAQRIDCSWHERRANVRPRALFEFPRRRSGAGEVRGGFTTRLQRGKRDSTASDAVRRARVAIFKALSEGERGFDAVAVVADTEVLTPPCGACRQILWEFCGDAEVVLANLKGKVELYRMSALFPETIPIALFCETFGTTDEAGQMEVDRF